MIHDDVGGEVDDGLEPFDDPDAGADDDRKVPPQKMKKRQVKLPAAKAKYTYEKRNVEELSPHPLHAEIPQTTAQEDENLLADIERNGMIDRIEILPNGTILSGHRRWEVAKTLGHEKVRVVVRHDLANDGSHAAARRLFEAEFNRRHLTNTHVARIFRRMCDEAAKGSNRRGKGTVRDEVARILGKSGRNLERWETLLDGPAEIVAAVEAKELPLLRAVELLKADDGEFVDTVVERLKRGESASAVAEEVLGPAKAAKAKDRVGPKKFVNWLRAGSAFAKNAAATRQRVTPDDVEAIRTLRKFLGQLLAGAEGRPSGGRQNRPTKKRKPR